MSSECDHCLFEELLTVDELAARLKVPKKWVYVATTNGLPTVKVGNHSRFLFSEVLQHLKQIRKHAE